MRNLVRTSWTLVGLAATLAPATTLAQSAPAGYAAPAPGTMMVVGPDGRPVPIAANSATKPGAPAAAHKHKGKTLCASCAKKQEAAMTGARIVACAHSKNGVCPTCRTLLEMPGTVTMGAPAAAPAMGEAPGRALVSSGVPAQAMPAGAQYAAQTAVYDPNAVAEPTPIGVMQTNYARPGAGAGAGGADGMRAGMSVPASAMMMGAGAPGGVPTASSMMPGHSLNESGVNPAPYQHKTTSSSNPHIIGHILGFRGIGSEWREERERKKSAAHASIPYNNEGTTISELPASMVYGGKH